MQAQSRLSVSSGSSVSADEHEAVIRELTRGQELTAQLRAEALREQGQVEDTAQVILQKVSQAFTVCLSIMSSPARSPGAAARRIRDENVPRR
jgi:chromosomal replication initiation ATPase DnaA